MAKGKKQDGIKGVEPPGPTGIKPIENFEIESLNADALDIEELETRLEMAVTIGDLGLYCGADCGSNCGVNCGNNCVGDLCGVDCGSDCGTFCNDCTVLNCIDAGLTGPSDM
jgi:hypothetical protein